MFLSEEYRKNSYSNAQLMKRQIKMLLFRLLISIIIHVYIQYYCWFNISGKNNKYILCQFHVLCKKNKPLEVQNFKIVCLQSFSPYHPLLCLAPKTLNPLHLPFDILDQSSVARHVSFTHAACVIHSACDYMHLYILMNYFL
jgi:hypothetical protein